jgi:hypothetical protein
MTTRTGLSKKMRLVGAAALAAVVGTCAPASATIITATFSGQVTYVSESDNLFGNPSVGDNFVEQFVLNTSQAVYNFQDSNQQFQYGGTYYYGGLQYVLSAMAIVNGLPITLSPNNGYAEAEYYDDVSGDLRYEAGNNAHSAGIDTVVYMFADLNSNYPTNPPWSNSISTPSNYDTRPDETSSFYILSYVYNHNTSTYSQWDEVDGTFANLTVTTGVPEPSTCAMMLLGFAGVGFAGYRGRRSAVAARALNLFLEPTGARP